MGEMEVFQDTSMLARAAAERFVSLANHAIKHRGRFLVALTGVPVLQDTYRLLTTEKFANKVDWSRVHVFVTDERAKRYDEPDNRYRLVRETLLEKVPVPSQHCHFIVAEAHPEAAASTYEAEIRSVIGHGDRLDLAFLSMGKDGDTASLLPGHPALEETEAHVVAVPLEDPALGYVTMTLELLNRARNVMFLVAGKEMADAVRRVEAGEKVPAALVKPLDGTLVWMIDRAAREGKDG